MVEIKQRFVEYNSLLDVDKKSISFDKLFVDVKGNIIPLRDLYLIKSDKKGVIKTKKITSFAEFDKNILNGKICTDEDGKDIVLSKFKVLYENFNVPTISDGNKKTGSSLDQTIENGLRRTLSVKKADDLDTEKLMYVQTSSGWHFSKINDFYWVKGTEKKSYSDYVALTKEEKEKTKLFTGNNEEILAVYTEHVFKAETLIAREELDINKFEKKSYVLDVERKPIYKIEKVNQYLSYQEFETKEVETEMGKTQTQSMIKVINYKASAHGEYVSVMVDTQLKIVKFSNLVDEKGDPITDLKSMLGKVLQVKEGDKIVATTKPLTFEQVSIRYDSIKTYQEIEGGPSKDSCLRLEDGTYVEELKSIQPISYKRAIGSDSIDSYLVENNGVSLVVDKNYFARHGNNSKFDASRAVPLTRCDFKDKNCELIQTTSNGDEIQLCSAIKDGISLNGKTLPKERKDDIYKSFLTSYKEGKYKVDSLYVNGKRRNIQKNSKRYQYTDVAYYDDASNSLDQYKSLSIKKIELKDGKIVGGGKYDIGKGIKNAYGTWLKFLKAGFFIVPAVSLFFLPISLPIAAMYNAGVLLAAPLIPICKVCVGLKRNVFNRKVFTDKTEYNRSRYSNDVEKELNLLSERTDLTQKGFEDVYARIMNKVATLSATTTNNTLNFKDGVAEVNPNNVNLANEFRKNFNINTQRLEYVNKLVEKAKKEFKKIDAEKAKYGSSVPSKVLSKWYKAKEKLDDLTKEQNDLLKQKADLKNYSIGKSYNDRTSERERLEKQAVAVKLKAYLEHTNSSVSADKKWSVSPVVQTKLDAIRSKVVCDDKLDVKIDGVSVFASEDIVNAQTDEWKSIRDTILNAIDELKYPEVEKPIDVNVPDELKRFKLFEKFNELVVELENKITTAKTELAKVKAPEHTTLEEDLKRIIEAKDDAKNIVNNTDKSEDVQQQIDVIKAEETNLQSLDKNINKAIEIQLKQDKKTTAKVDNVKLNGEKLVCDKINDLLTSSSYTDEDKHILDVLLTKTGLEKKELAKKLKALHKKMQENIDNNVNTKLSKSYLPYAIVEIIAEELHLDKKMFDTDPNQFSMPI